MPPFLIGSHITHLRGVIESVVEENISATVPLVSLHLLYYTSSLTNLSNERPRRHSIESQENVYAVHPIIKRR